MGPGGQRDVGAGPPVGEAQRKEGGAALGLPFGPGGRKGARGGWADSGPGGKGGAELGWASGLVWLGCPPFLFFSFSEFF